jgi:hypothetical protein
MRRSIPAIKVLASCYQLLACVVSTSPHDCDTVPGLPSQLYNLCLCLPHGSDSRLISHAMNTKIRPTAEQTACRIFTYTLGH